MSGKGSIPAMTGGSATENYKGERIPKKMAQKISKKGNKKAAEAKKKKHYYGKKEVTVKKK